MVQRLQTFFGAFGCLISIDFMLILLINVLLLYFVMSFLFFIGLVNVEFLTIVIEVNVEFVALSRR